MTWLWDIFRTLLSLLDKVVYWVITLLISLFDQLASVRVFDTEVIEGFATRIYFLISVVMIFKVSFSIIQYIINPDSISDNSKGMGKLIQNVLLVLVSLVGVRYIFDFAYNLQDAVIDSHVIEKLILGSDANSGASELDAEQQAEIKSQIPYSLLSAFIKPNYEKISNFQYDETDGMYTCNSFGMYTMATKKNENEKNENEKNENEKNENEKNEKVIAGYNEQFFDCIDDISDKDTNRTFNDNGKEIKGKSGTMYYYASTHNNYELLLELVNDNYSEDDDVYIFEYKFLISTVAGVFVIIIYLNFCIDLAIRSVKFGFLQLIAPIPIISMIDPKSASGGMMSKWIKNCTNTYLGLFIRIAAVNFVVYIVNIIFTTNITGNSGAEVGTFVKIVVLFGALMFAKDLPKLITELTGIDMSGNFKMNPFSRVTSMPVVGNVAKAGGNIGAGALRAAGHLVGGGVATGAAALGSLAQASIGAAKGQGWNFNSDRVKRQVKLMGQREANSAINMLNKAGSNMASIVGAKPKGIPTGGDRKPSARQEYKKMEKDLKLGEELYKKQQAGENIYSNEEFSNGVKDYKTAKNDKVAAENEYNELQARANNGDQQALASLGEASKRRADAEAAFNIQKERFDKLCALSKNAENAKKYNALKSYKDSNPGLSSPSTVAEQLPPNYMNELNNDSSRVASIPPSNGTMDSVTPPSRSGNRNNNNNNPSTPFDPNHMDG